MKLDQSGKGNEILEMADLLTDSDHQGRERY